MTAPPDGYFPPSSSEEEEEDKEDKEDENKTEGDECSAHSAPDYEHRNAHHFHLHEWIVSTDHAVCHTIVTDPHRLHRL
jgi:hypothetical protein